jgi:Ca-activated chloride channel family protein
MMDDPGWLGWMARAAGSLGLDRLEHPEVLGWAIPLALLPLALAFRPRTAIGWPALREAARAGASIHELHPWALAAWRSLALMSLACVLAGPQRVLEQPPEPGLGLDLVLVLDTSHSMAAIETGHDGANAHGRTRLDLARAAVEHFAQSRLLAGDRIALVVFGDSAFTQCPPTSDGALLAAALDRVDVGIAGDATALGDALALAVKRASHAESAGKRAIVMLTDGRSTAGDLPVSVATALAVAESVRVHTVAIGSGGAPVAVETAAGLRFERHEPDPEALRQIAERTGGRAFEVRTPADLIAVHAAIDALERGERPLPTRHVERPHPEPLLAISGGLLALEILLGRVFSRRLP